MTEYAHDADVLAEMQARIAELEASEAKLKQTQRALRESEAQYRMTIDAMDDLIHVVDHELKFILFNEALRKFASAAGIQDDLVGQELFAVFPFLSPQVREEYMYVLKSGRPLNTEESTEVEEHLTWTETHKIPIFDEEGKVCRIVTVIRDITERKQTEKALRRYAERLKSLHEIEQAILGASSSEAIVLAVLSHIRRLIPCQRAIMIEFSETGEAKVLAVEAARGIEIDVRVESRRGLFSMKALKAGRVQGVEDLAALPRRSTVQEMLYSKGIRSYLLVPLVDEEQLVGVLNLESYRPHAFTPDRINVAMSVAASLAIAIRQARLYEQTRQDAATKAALLLEVNHRVKNNLSAIIGLLYTARRHAEVEDQGAYKVTMDELIGRVRGLATVHNMLSACSWAPLPLSDLAAQIIHSALQTFHRARRLSVDVCPSPVYVTPDQAHHLALVINELATNTVKYALGERDTGQISLCITTQDDVVHCEFRDDGPGYPDDVLRLERLSIGFDMIRNIVRDNLRGDLALYNDAGAVTVITFKAGSN